jgi:hypothetical protein
MAMPIIYVDRSEITGDVTQLKEAISTLVAFVREREPRLVTYGFYIDEAGSAMSVVAVHPDSESLGLHLAIGGPEFRKVGQFIDLQLIEVFGEPSEAILVQLQQKARMLGKAARVSVHSLEAGFARPPAGAS